MRWNLIGAFVRNKPFGTECAFQKGLERLGETVTVVDPSAPGELDPLCDATVIFKELEDEKLLKEVSKLQGAKFVYQPDDLAFPHIGTIMRHLSAVCPHALVFDDRQVEMALRLGFKTAHCLLITADDTLYRPMDLPKDFDVCFVGSFGAGREHESRMRMMRIAQSMGLKTSFHVGIRDPNVIAELYNRSKVVLHHATDIGQGFGLGYGFQCRHFEAGSTGACVLSNDVIGVPYLKNIEKFSSTETFVHQLKALMLDEKWRTRVGQLLLQEIREAHLPQHRAMELVKLASPLSLEIG